MQTIKIKVTKLHQILSNRAMNQNDLYELIKQTNKGKAPAKWIINGLVTGKKENVTIRVLKTIKNALGVTYDELIDD